MRCDVLALNLDSYNDHVVALLYMVYKINEGFTLDIENCSFRSRQSWFDTPSPTT